MDYPYASQECSRSNKHSRHCSFTDFQQEVHWFQTETFFMVKRGDEGRLRSYSAMHGANILMNLYICITNITFLKHKTSTKIITMCVDSILSLCDVSFLVLRALQVLAFANENVYDTLWNSFCVFALLCNHNLVIAHNQKLY